MERYGGPEQWGAQPQNQVSAASNRQVRKRTASSTYSEMEGRTPEREREREREREKRKDKREREKRKGMGMRQERE